MKLLSSKANLKEESENNQNRTFFCSELVAATYKKLGLLPEKISASSYWPGK